MSRLSSSVTNRLAADRAPLELPPELRRQLRRGRELIERRGERVPPEADPKGHRFPTALSELDRLLGGGLARGSMVEIIGRRTSGRFSLVLSTLAAATRLGEAAALVDLGDHFDPQGAATAGVELERLLWLRPEHVKTALASVEILLDGGFPLVIFDLGLPPVPGGRGAEAAWLRLARSAQAHAGTLLVTSPYRASGTAARVVLQLERVTGRDPSFVGEERSPLLLCGLRTRVTLAKSRLDPARATARGGDTDFELRLHSDSLAEPLRYGSGRHGTSARDEESSAEVGDVFSSEEVRRWLSVG